MSTFKEAIQSGLEEYLQALTRALEGLTPTEIRWQATSHTNHIAWLVWHMARVEDGWVSRLRRGPTVWQADGWAARFHMDPTGSGGAGHTMEEVRAMPEIPLPDLMAYFDAVRAVTRQYLEQATDADLSREYPRARGGVVFLAAHRYSWCGVPPRARGCGHGELDRGAHPGRGESTHGTGGLTAGYDAWAGRLKHGANGVPGYRSRVSSGMHHLTPWEVAGDLSAVEAMPKAIGGEASSFVSSQHLTFVRPLIAKKRNEALWTSTERLSQRNDNAFRAANITE